MQVVGIDLSLVRAHRVLPSAQRSHHGLHVEVAALHDTHLDRRTSALAAFLGKLDEFGLEVPCIRQVRLHHDAGRIVEELWLRQHFLEEAHGEVSVLVFLHVEVDELRTLLAILINVWVVDGCLVEFRHAAYELRERLLIVKCMGLGVDTRDLDRDVVDVWLLESFKVAVVALVGFFIAQHHLTEEVDVLSDLLFEAFSKVLGEMRTCSIDDDARGIHSQTLLDDRDGDRVEIVAESLIDLEEEGIALVKELWDSILVDEHLDTLGEFLVVADL